MGRIEPDGAGIHDSGSGVLRNGRIVWFRGRQVRRLDRHWRTGTPTGGAQGSSRLVRDRQRLQLPGADPPGNRPLCPPFGGNSADRPPRRPLRTCWFLSGTAPGPRPRGEHPPVYAKGQFGCSRAGRGWGVALASNQKTLILRDFLLIALSKLNPLASRLPFWDNTDTTLLGRHQLGRPSPVPLRAP